MDTLSPSQGSDERVRGPLGIREYSKAIRGDVNHLMTLGALVGSMVTGSVATWQVERGLEMDEKMEEISRGQLEAEEAQADQGTLNQVIELRRVIFGREGNRFESSPEERAYALPILIDLESASKAPSERVNLRGLDMTGVEAVGMDFGGTDLSRANLAGAIGLEQHQLDLACGDEETKLPEGMRINPCKPD